MIVCLTIICTLDQCHSLLLSRDLNSHSQYLLLHVDNWNACMQLHGKAKYNIIWQILNA